jgi:lipopolysaccharide heptosyltransferase II
MGLQQMNSSSQDDQPAGTSEAAILIVPYMWIGDFVRCHTVAKLVRQRFPARPIDVLATSMLAPLVDYMPGVRKAVVVDLPRGRVALQQHRALAQRLRAERYAQVLVMPRTWKAALAPYLAGIPARTGFIGEARLGLINDLRFGERRLPRMVDRCAALALPKGGIGSGIPAPQWPLPELRVPPSAVMAWRSSRQLRPDGKRVVAFAPGAVGPSKRWPYYAALASSLAREGNGVWIIGGPGEATLAREIVQANPEAIHDLTGPDLRTAVLAFAAADAAVSNDSGLLHVAAALGTPAIGIFGPTSPWHWAPLNPVAAVIEPLDQLPCRPCHKPVCRLGHHRCMRDIALEKVAAATRRALHAAAACELS